MYIPFLGKQDPKSHEFSLKLQISVMVSIAVSKMGMTELTFVDPGMKVNSSDVVIINGVLVLFYLLLALLSKMV